MLFVPGGRSQIERVPLGLVGWLATWLLSCPWEQPVGLCHHQTVGCNRIGHGTTNLLDPSHDGRLKAIVDWDSQCIPGSWWWAMRMG
eukprot:10926838-Ditylum_brightwellii.AAC.1